jgi:hypothetical protein
VIVCPLRHPPEKRHALPLRVVRLLLFKGKHTVHNHRAEAGTSMLQGGGTIVLRGEGDVHGPGHNSVLRVDGSEYLVHHMYDGKRGGVAASRSALSHGRTTAGPSRRARSKPGGPLCALRLLREIGVNGGSAKVLFRLPLGTEIVLRSAVKI